MYILGNEGLWGRVKNVEYEIPHYVKGIIKQSGL